MVPPDGTTPDDGQDQIDTDDGGGGLEANRRHFLGAAAVAGGAAGLGWGVAAQEGDDQDTEITFDGIVEAWVYTGDMDASFLAEESEENPTLRLQAGTQYTVVWTNDDGLPHNFAVRDEEGEAFVNTETISEEGATQEVTFTAEEGMTTYICDVHPTTMVGDVEIVDNGDGQTTTTTTAAPGDGDPFFGEGAEVGVQMVAEGMTAPTDFATVPASDGTGGNGQTTTPENEYAGNETTTENGLGNGNETTTENDLGNGNETTTENGLGNGNETTTENGLGNETTTDDGTNGTTPANGDGQQMHFVADQTGEVWVVTEDGLQDEPFIDVSDRMVELGEFNGQYANPESEYDERGLLGIDLHPDFQENGRFFLHYSAPPNEETPPHWSHVEVVSEFQASDDMSSGDPESEQVLLEWQSPQYNHDAGPMAFGPDGYLYVPMGDGGGADDDLYGHVDDWYLPNDGGNGQDVTENLLGDILRIDVDDNGDGENGAGNGDDENGLENGDGENGQNDDQENGTQNGDDQGNGDQPEDLPYGIPDDNPFVGVDDARDEIYAYGFRNPFGISFDSEGNMFVADAGQNLYEEASIVERGGNYGWNVKEGTHCFSSMAPSDPTAITDCPDSEPDEAPYTGQEFGEPIVEYPHTYQEQSVGIVIVGGHRYEAGDIDDLEGKYIFGDWSADPARAAPEGRIFAATPPDDFGENGDGQNGNETTTENGLGNGNETTTENGLGNGNETTTAANGNATTENGNGAVTTTADDGQQNGMDDDVGDVPRDELWEMEEVTFAGSDDGALNYFVRMFGQGNDGEVYVLANREGVPEGDSGVVLQIVPSEEGEDIPPVEEPATTTTTEDDETTTEDGLGDGNETTTDDGLGDGNETTTGNGQMTGTEDDLADTTTAE